MRQFRLIHTWQKIILLISLLLLCPFIPAQKVSMADNYCLIVCPDGTVSAMGANWWGQLGDSTYINKSTPVKVDHLHNITDVSAPGMMALQDDGTLWKWSWHGRYKMSKVDITDVKAISSCHQSDLGSRSFAIKRDGTLWTWTNANGTSDGVYYEDTVPVKVNGIPKVTSIKCSSTFQVYIALCEDGSVYTWGSSTANGNGTYYPGGDCPEIPQPVRVNSIDHVRAVAAGTGTAYALKQDGTVWQWGWMTMAACSHSLPAKIDISNVASIYAEEDGLYMATKDGTLWAWGISNELGVAVDVRNKPGQVMGVDHVTDLGTNGYSGMTTIAIKNDGTYWGWGYNYFGQLGDSTNNRITYPELLPFSCPVIDCRKRYPDPVTLKLDTIVPINSVVNLTCSPSRLYNWQYYWFNLAEGYNNSQSISVYVQSESYSIFASLIDSDGCYRYEQFNVRSVCDTIVKVKDKLVLDTAVVAGTTIALKASEAVSYFWFPWANTRVNEVYFTHDIECVATLTDEFGCNRKERFNLRKICDNSTLTTPQAKMDTLTYQGQTLTLSASEGSSVSWLPVTGLDCDTCSNTRLLVSTPGNYVATITDFFGCVRKEEFKIRIADCDSIAPSKDRTILDTLVTPGARIQLNASVAENYHWSPQDGLSCDTCRSPEASILLNSEYTVILTDMYHCQWTERFKIKNDCDSNSLNNPVLIFDTLTYPSALIQFEAKQANSYAWTPKGSLTCDDCRDPLATVTGPLTYFVTSEDRYGCIAREKFNIRVRDCDTIVLNSPVVLLDTVIHYATEIPLAVSQSYNGYQWNQTGGLSCSDCEHPILMANKTSQYIVTLSDKWQCPITEEFHITMISYDVVIPNVFTPNGDSKNEFFEIKGLIPESDLRIYDDKGILVFSASNYENDWNGTSGKGELLPEGTYWYILRIPGMEIFKGWVYLKK
jgi:gliding motility-associated-like protein